MNEILDNLDPESRAQLESELKSASKKLPPWAWILIATFLGGGGSAVAMGERFCTIVFGMEKPAQVDSQVKH